MERRCDKCEFWDLECETQISSETGVSGSFCCRYPPIIYIGEEESRQPFTWANDWCGEFNIKKREMIDGSDLPGRARYSLTASGLVYIDEIEKFTASDLKKLRNLGKGTIELIIDYLAKRGMKLAE